MLDKEFSKFNGKKVLVVGGAGFVGSNLVLKLLEQDPKEIIIVDNLLSSDISNVVDDPRVTFVFGSITSDKILKNLPDDLEYAWHLSCYHGNQSSIHDPMADHHSRRLFTLLQDARSLKKHSTKHLQHLKMPRCHFTTTARIQYPS